MPIILLIVGLALLAGILLALVMLIRKVNSPSRNHIDVRLQTGIDEAIERLGEAVEHHVDVNAVVTMVRQLDEYPDALELIKSYPESVRAAAWLHYTNTLGASLQEAQSQLAHTHKMRGEYGSRWDPNVVEAQKHVDAIRGKLDAAIVASGLSTLRTV